MNTSDSKPLSSRFLMSMRTRHNFNDVDKLSDKNLVENILAKEAKKNMYQYTLKRSPRQTTKHRYDQNIEV